jgi:hypothetical protein
VTVETCDGLPSGLYHYNPLDPQLHGVAARNAHIEQLLRDAQAAAALSMYLVATVMGLAPCALGGGNAALFTEAIGTDYCAESFGR